MGKDRRGIKGKPLDGERVTHTTTTYHLDPWREVSSTSLNEKGEFRGPVVSTLSDWTRGSQSTGENPET